ncbi:glycosyltransferase [Desulfobacca acetoxidans]|uniref:Glycosyl transferase group 1 n=1 Tax=Desulfobacca acetoxidans (strain ATCC 700848 / DSM 11109 / ASRB2) TaxID=880072 RepID=F2NJJ5_DESAR|nr:glycosyltransferase [Desulfobacca acetoxidans]AEB09507.1 glycosyl transferase group 1 [Desulfobacca acetoxidans DSM 11109]
MPTMWASKTLAKTYQVLVLCKDAFETKGNYPSPVKIIKIGPKRLDFNEFANLSAIQKGRDYWEFCLSVFKFIENYRPEVLIVYYPVSFFIGFISAKLFKIPLLYYVNEYYTLSDLPKKLSFHYFYKLLEKILSKKADAIIDVEKNRLRLFRKFAHLDNTPSFVVTNCPLSGLEIPTRIPKILSQCKNQKKKILLYQGIISDGHCHAEMVRALIDLPEEVVLVLLGHGQPDYKASLQNLAKTNGVEHRLLLLDRVSPEELFSYIAAADIGLLLYRPKSLNSIYAAPGKLFEYLAMGVPVIYPGKTAIREIIGPLDVGEAYREETPEDLAKSVRYLLNRLERDPHIKKRARESYLQQFNYETQFAPVMDFIAQLIKSSSK